MARGLICTAQTQEQAHDIVDRLRAAGFSAQDTSLVLSVNEEAPEVRRAQAKKLQGAATGTSVGAVAGGLLGLLVGMTAFDLPDAGMLIAVGPIVGALSDAIAGGALGAIAGALVGIRLPERSAKQYEEMVAKGNVLISIQAEDTARRETAREIFRAMGAEQISDMD